MNLLILALMLMVSREDNSITNKVIKVYHCGNEVHKVTVDVFQDTIADVLQDKYLIFKIFPVGKDTVLLSGIPASLFKSANCIKIDILTKKQCPLKLVVEKDGVSNVAGDRDRKSQCFRQNTVTFVMH